MLALGGAEPAATGPLWTDNSGHGLVVEVSGQLSQDSVTIADLTYGSSGTIKPSLAGLVVIHAIAMLFEMQEEPIHAAVPSLEFSRCHKLAVDAVSAVAEAHQP